MRPLRQMRLVRVLAILAFLTLGLAPTMARSASSSITPNAVNSLDCNGYSPVYPSVSNALKRLCTDPIAVDEDGSAYRFLDNGHYVGHDEPSVKFISTAPGSANHMTYLMQLAKDPAGTPTTSPTGTTTSDYAELSIAPWFGLPLCDPNSYPLNPCTPDSDSNGSAISDPNAAGSAFLEVQFYPPGYGPFLDNVSCDPTRYCASLHINSLECTFGFATCNNNCFETTNFAFIQTDGIPTGPPSPQLSNVNTFTPDSKTLFMNPGDALNVTIGDTSQGVRVDILDMTTGQRGFMVASAANGYATTHIADCSGMPFDFHAEYSSASQQNQVPWAALEGGVLMEDELGHFEPCNSVTNPFPIGGGPSFSDPSVYQTCVGGFEGSSGEGPCSFTTGVCQNPTTQNGAACPTNNFASGALCEFSDAACMPAGSRTVTTNGVAQSVSQPIAGCLQTVTQNGDLDFDGSPYIADWPDGSATHPTPFNYVGPFDAANKPYPQIQVETDGPASEILCNVNTGAGCTVPPTGAAFYPYWTLAKFSSSQPRIGIPDRSGQCVWSFGNTIAGQTTNTMGGTSEYGQPNVARFGGTAISPVQDNPALSKSC